MVDRRVNREEDEQFEEHTTATIAEAFDVMVDASGIVKRNADFLSRVATTLAKTIRPLVWVVGVAFLSSLILVGQLIFRDNRIERLELQIVELNTQVEVMQKSADDARTASQDAKVASDAAKQALNAAIENSQQAGQDSNEAIKRINDIYDTCVIRKEC